MCVARPREVLSVGAEIALVRTGGREREVSTMLVPDLCVGDYVIVAGDIVVERLDSAEAKVRLAIFDELEEYTDERA